MLSIFSGSGSPTCDGVHRRDFLRLGALGLGGLTLADLLRARAQTSGVGNYLKDRSVILLFLAGGPSQYETFDPKPDGPDTSTSIAGHIPTKLPGVRFASYLRRLAKLADRLTVVRSFQTNHAEHNGAHKQILTADLSVKDGKPITQPGLGSVYARVAGAVNQRTGMPRHALLPPTTRYGGIKAGFAGAFESVVEGCQPAGLGSEYAPFQVQVPMSGGAVEKRKKKKKGEEDVNPLLDNLEPHLPDLRLDSRLSLLQQIDRLDRRMDVSGVMDGMDRYTRQAVELLRGGSVRKALDLSLEDPRTLAAYDTEHFRNWNCDEKSTFIRTGPSIGFSLGRQLLMARRLCEAGCGFVTVINANWDFHARKNIPNIPEGMGVFGPPLDHAVSAFLEDIEQRGLSKKILLVITGEFGRTPKLDKNLGRHHWPRICPLVFAGGGLNHGQVVGQSDHRGGQPAGTPITIDDLHATILHAMVDVGKMRLDASLPRPVLDRAQRGRPIRELF
jgi:Protein of unknown function (DUF1501)